jgi:hypothetical protein
MIPQETLGNDSTSAAEAAFLDQLDDAFLEAERRTSLRRQIRLGGRLGVQLRFADEALAAALLPALAWLEPDETLPWRFEIRAFAGGVTPPCPWTPGGRRRGELNGDAESPVVVSIVTRPPILTVVDRARRLAWYWASEPRSLPIWERAAPFYRMLPQIARDEAMTLAHAAALADGRRSLALIGKGGSGKSTSALAGLASGLELLGDDYVLLAERANVFGAAPLYASAKADDESLEMLARAGVRLSERGREAGGKSVLVPPSTARPRGDGWRPLAAIVLPRIAERDGPPIPISPARALRALAPSSLFQLPFAGKRELDRFARAVRHVPAFELPVGPDLSTVGPILEGFLTRAGEL